MNKAMKTLGIGFYGAYALVSIISIFIGVGEVAENLDGWHDFSTGHSFVFVMLCIVLAAGAFYNLIGVQKNTFAQFNIAAGLLLFICPLVIHLVANSLQGNVDSDFRYLILRNFQGFDKTYLIMTILGAIALVVGVVSRKNKAQE